MMNRHHNDTDKYPTIRVPIVESKLKKTTKGEIALLIVLVILTWVLILSLGFLLLAWTGTIGV